MERHQNSTSLENRTNEYNDLVSSMTALLDNVQPPEDSKVSEQCIYRAPHRIRLTNPEAYTPHLVSIGPIHSPLREGGDSRLKPMEELKLKYFKSFLNRTKLSVSDCISKLKELTITSCYAEPVELKRDVFLKMVLIDACFIIEYFLRFYSLEYWAPKDPILSKLFVNDIRVDLILVENQLPFFVLEEIYNLSLAPNSTTTDSPSFTANIDPSFLKITINYFKPFNLQDIKAEDLEGRVKVQHFVDLLRTFLLPDSMRGPLPTESRVDIGSRVDIVQPRYSASQLLEAGVVFKVSPSKCLLCFHFDKGVLTMACFKIDSSTEVLMRNIVAFEKCHYHSSRYITEYIKILDFLINTEKDAETLVQKKIIDNLLGDNETVARLVNSLSTNVTLPHVNRDFRTLCEKLNGFYENPRNKYKAIFIHEYFNTPWKIASTIAAILLLLLTFIQTVCSIVALFKD